MLAVPLAFFGLALGWLGEAYMFGVNVLCFLRVGLFKSSLYINNRQPYGSLSNVLRRPVVVEGSGRRGLDLT